MVRLRIIIFSVLTTGFYTQLFSQQVKDLLPEWTFTKGIEGPSFDSKGNLYAVNFGEQGTVGVVTPYGKASCYLRLPEGSIGNGIRFDSKGFMYIADYTGHNILKVDPLSKKIEFFAHEPSMNQPNDIAISPSTGLIYASDPNWKDSTGKLWMIDLTGKVHLLEDNMGTTNGIEVSPDGQRLYVNESIKRVIWVYDILPNGFVSSKRMFYKFTDFGMDGMRCDKWGNLYVTRHGKGSVIILSPKGDMLKEVFLKGKLCSNIALKNVDSEITAFVTMADRGCFEYFTIKMPDEWK